MGNPKPVAVFGSVFNKFADNKDETDSAHSAFGDKNAGGTFDVEDLAMGMIKFDNGACLQIEFSWASNVEKEAVFVEMRGSKAGFKWEHDTVTLYTDDSGSVTPTLPPGKRSHEANLYHFINDVLIGGQEPDFTPEQGVNMIKILTAIYKSAETGREVVL